jgi:hypothetical protein
MQALKLDKYKHAWELTFTVLLPGFNSINVNGIKGWGGGRVGNDEMSSFD